MSLTCRYCLLPPTMISTDSRVGLRVLVLVVRLRRVSSLSQYLYLTDTGTVECCVTATTCTIKCFA